MKWWPFPVQTTFWSIEIEIVKFFVIYCRFILEKWHNILTGPIHDEYCTHIIWELQWCWWLTVGDKFWMLVTEISYRWQLLDGWCPTLILKNKECWWLKLPKPLSTSSCPLSTSSCQQHISSPTSVTFRSSLNFFEIGNMVKIYLCKCVSIDQKYSATFNLIAMCCQPIFSSQIYIPINLIFKETTLRNDTKTKNTFCVQSAAGHGPNSDFKPGFGFIFSLVIFSLYINVWIVVLFEARQVMRLNIPSSRLNKNLTSS